MFHLLTFSKILISKDPLFHLFPFINCTVYPKSMCQKATLSSCCENNFASVSHVIFDLDGTLLNTEIIYEEVMETIANSYGKTMSLDLRMQVLGRTERTGAELLVAALELPITIDEYIEEYHRLCSEKLINVDLMKGAKRLLCHLHCNKIPFALGTSSSAAQVDIKLTKHRKLFKLFNHFVCGSSDPEVKNGKPAPDIFLVAASRFPDNPDPAKCLVFEDAPNGVKAAKNAGMQVVMIPAATTPQELQNEATLVLNSMEEFQPEMFGLPPLPKYTCYIPK